MKKILAIIFSVMILGVLLVSCGNEDETEKISATGETSDVTVSKYSGIEEWIEKESAQINNIKEEMAVNGLTMNVTHNGNSLVYQCTLNEISKEAVTDEMTEQLRKDVEEQNEALQSVLKMIRAEVPSVESLIYEYYDKSGNLILKHEIK